jgi:hypothetical protein
MEGFYSCIHIDKIWNNFDTYEKHHWWEYRKKLLDYFDNLLNEIK